MSTVSKIGVVLAILHILFLLFVMHRMSGGELITDPIGLVFAAWAIAPTGFVARQIKTARIWVLALVPIILFGTYEAYIMGFVSKSSTTALGLIFLPIYEWFFIGCFGLILLVWKK